jgi:DNA polymerase-3 subunit beta
MKFKVPVSDLQYAMRTVRDVVPSTGPSAETAGVKISVQGERATFSAFNPELMVKASINVSAEEEGDITIGAGALYSAVSHFQPIKESGVGTSDISLVSAKRSKRLHLYANTKYASGATTPHKRAFPLKSTGAFPNLPATKDVKESFEIPADVLMDGIDSVAYAVSGDQQQFMFTGILFQIEEGKLILFATNGICLAEYVVPIDYTGDPVRIVMPGSFASKVSKSFFDNDALSAALTRSMLYMRTADLILGGTLIGDEYPDYTSVLPKPTSFAEVDKHIFLDNLLSLSYEASLVDDSRVTVYIENGEASLRCGHAENNGIPAKSEASMTFDCNLKLLAGSVKNVYGDTLKIGFAGKGRPLTFSSDEDTHNGAKLTCVLVPLTT